MKIIKCIVIDDEPISREIIENFILRISCLKLLDSFSKPYDALDYLQKNSVDLIFSDIEMPQMSGIDLIKSLPYKPLIILITAYKEYALDGFDSGVIDYLVKPVSYERFVKSINRVQEILKINIVTESIEIDRIFIKSDNKLVKIYMDEIIYIESLKDYVKIHLSEKESYVTYSTMKAMEEKLPSEFFRIQRSYIINTKYIKSFYGNSVKMTIGNYLPISNSYKSILYEKLGLDTSNNS